jgi:S-formylglutathione hydrolase FrmB
MAVRFRVLIVLVVLLAFAGQPQAHAAECPAPRCREVRVPLPRSVKVPENRVRVLLPDGYAKGTARYPVVYLLHGVADSYTTWTRRTDVVAFTRRIKAIVVMPDGGSGSEAGWHSDWRDGSRQWETFHTKVLVRYIDEAFRTMGAGHRAVIGNSMGGFGAMSYAARHRGLFRVAASFSGAVDTMYAFPLSGPFFEYGGRGLAGQSLGTPSDGVWGDQLSEEDEWRRHNPTDLAAKLKGVKLYVSSGMGTPAGPSGDDPSRPHGYATENFIYQMNLSFTGALDDAGVGYTSDFHGGYHDWPYWERDLHLVLPKVVRAIS